MTSTASYSPLTDRAKNLRRFVNAARLWSRKCADLSAARNAAFRSDGKNEAATADYTAAVDAWRKGRMPSKRSKYRAYDDAGALERFLAENGVFVKRATTVDELDETWAAYKAFVR